MTYIPDLEKAVLDLAQPASLVFIPHTMNTSQTFSVNDKVSLGTPDVKFGSWSPSINSNIITLSQGYYYYIQSAPQFYRAGSYSFPDNLHSTVQHYDETNSQYAGILGTVYTPSGQDSSNFSRDESCKYYVDCSSSPLNISLKIQANSNHDYINYNSDHHIYAGHGRTIIWQLN